MHIRDVLDAIAARDPDLIVKFGGHAMAAGLTLELAKLERFARAFDEEVARCSAERGRADCIETDGELAVAEIALETASALRAGGPWGQAFPGAVLRWHLRHPLRARRRRAAPEDVGGGADERAQLRCDRIQLHRSGRRRRALPRGLAQLVYRLDINEYQGERRLQLLVDHLLPA